MNMRNTLTVTALAWLIATTLSGCGETLDTKEKAEAKVAELVQTDIQPT